MKRGQRRWHLRADRDRGKWADDRQAFETRDLVKDRDAYFLCKAS